MYSDFGAEIASVRYGLDGICTIIADDGVYSTVEEFNKLSKKYKIKLTVAQTIMNITDLERFQKIEGHNKIEFISHSFNHINMGEDGISQKTLYHEIVESKEYMEKHFTTHQIAFIPPNNQLSEEAYNICSKNFYAIRRWIRELNPLSPRNGVEPLNWLNLGCKGIGDVKTTLERNKWVDECINSKKWLIEMWHNIDNNKKDGYQTISPDEAEEHIAYICDKDNLWSASFTEAIKYILEKQTTVLSTRKIAENKWRLSLSKGISEIDSRFDMPLTILIYLPGNSKSIAVINENGDSSRKSNIAQPLIFEMFPGEIVDILIPVD